MARPARAAAAASTTKTVTKGEHLIFVETDCRSDETVATGAKGKTVAKPTVNGKAAAKATTKATSTTPVNTANTSRKRKSPSESEDESPSEAEAGPSTKKAKSTPATSTKATTTKKAAASKKTAPAKKTAAAKKTAVAKKVPATKKEAASKTVAAPKKPAAPRKTVTKKAIMPEDAAPSKKRKVDETEGEETEAPEEAGPATKKVKTVRTSPAPKVVAPKVTKKGPVINTAPTERIDVYVFGEGSAGELGLGPSRKAIDVKRPRINKLLDADTVGVVQVAVGGMHCAALTYDNKIVTWGVNDQGALGRDTKWEAPLVEPKDDDKSDSDENTDDDSGLNPLESTPAAIPSDAFPEGTVFTQLACGDSITLALTDDGHVWAWGTFRVSFLPCSAYPVP